MGNCLENGIGIEKHLVRALKIPNCLLTRANILDKIVSIDALSWNWYFCRSGKKKELMKQIVNREISSGRYNFAVCLAHERCAGPDIAIATRYSRLALDQRELRKHDG
jgi:hypothetical protein